MAQELEIEFKNLLSENEYQKLINYFEIDEKDYFIQENIYFDTSDFKLKQHHAALRIRIKNDFAEMTLKTPKENHLLETTLPLTLESARQLIDDKHFLPTSEIAQTLEKLGLNTSEPVQLITYLKTKRAEKSLKDGLVVLDQSWYGNQSDYELEVEARDEQTGEKFFLQILESFDIPRRETKNKIQRAQDAFFNE